MTSLEDAFGRRPGDPVDEYKDAAGVWMVVRTMDELVPDAMMRERRLAAVLIQVVEGPGVLMPCRCRYLFLDGVWRRADFCLERSKRHKLPPRWLRDAVQRAHRIVREQEVSR